MNKWIASVHRILDQEQLLIMATVLSQTGSTPRTAGTRMIILPDGEILGTIGGGIIEAKVIKTAGEMFGTNDAAIRTFDMTSEITDNMDMICGGQMEILIEPCVPDEDTLHVFESLLHELAQRCKSVLVTEMLVSSAETCRVRRALIRKDWSIVGTAVIQDSLKTEIDSAMTRGLTPVLREVDNSRFFIEPHAAATTVYLFGAGHVSLQVAILAKNVHFQTVILDDRHEFANHSRFVTADDVKVLPTFEHAIEGLEIDEVAYMVILTHGHSHDKTVLRQVLGTPAGYVGMIGSTKKRDAIYKALQDEGVSAGDLERVHCPIGLPIKAQTPEEIAVSIVAELIHARAAGYTRI
ncbi:MAG: XdhC family protein [Thermodesulfobacteriota bacterium]|nr:XdhC family protein [Thermodesulfobacteriota bacterium]